MNSELKRRDFLQLISRGGLGFSMLSAPAVAHQLQDRGLRAASASNESRNPYFEFSSDGMECIIRRPDTPVPWMNLLANDGFQTWITHQGFMECALLDRSVNGLTNPQEASGYIYVRDADSAQFFVANRPAEQTPWECRQGVGYTKITTAGLGIETAITYFVPREGSILIWNLTLRNRRERPARIDLFSTVEWNLGDQNKTMVFRGHGGGGDPFTGGSQFNLYKKVWHEDGILYAEQKIWRKSLTNPSGENLRAVLN